MHFSYGLEKSRFGILSSQLRGKTEQGLKTLSFEPKIVIRREVEMSVSSLNIYMFSVQP